MKLNWSLNTSAERTDFVQQYCESHPNLTQSDLDTLANYILWADKPEDIEIPRRHSTWEKKTPISLDELLESPTFDEKTLRVSAQIKVPRQVFSREETRKSAPAYLLGVFEELWREIDELEVKVGFWELERGKREKPLREELTNRFTEEALEKLREKAKAATQDLYWKWRHLLVEKRTEQYGVRDGYVGVIRGKTWGEEEEGTSEVDVWVKPLSGAPSTPCSEATGERNNEAQQEQNRHSQRTPAKENTAGENTQTHNSHLSSSPTWRPGHKMVEREQRWKELVFRPFRRLNFWEYGEEELKFISEYLWNLKGEEMDFAGGRNVFDFRDDKCVYHLLGVLEEFEDHWLKEIFEYYMREADLSEIQRDVLGLKLEKMKNVDIAAVVNEKYGKYYTPNYISTIFTQKIVPAITEAATLHEEIVGKLFFEEEFKKCSQCGEVYLRHNRYFMKKSRSKDGLSSHCKECDRRARENKKRREKDGQAD